MSDDIKKIVEDIGKDFEAFKSSISTQTAEMIKRGSIDPLLKQQEDRIVTALADLEATKQRLERVENASARRAEAEAEVTGRATPEMLAHKKAFENWIRRRGDPEAAQELVKAERAVKAISTLAPETGGYAVPEVIATQVLANLLEISPIRSIARVQTVGTPDFKQLVNVRGSTYGWVGETATRNATVTPDLQEVKPTTGTLYAYPAATEESLNDMFFNVGAWLVENITEDFAKGEGIAFISGNGSNKPTGFLNGSPVAIGDDESPARAFGTLQYIPTGTAANFQPSRVDSPPGDPGDVFIQTAYTIKSGYRRNARWVMNKNTMSRVMRFKDAEGNYLWRPGIAAGQPSTLIGYPITEADDMPDVGANTFPVAFGDFQQGYLITDLVGFRLTEDNNITTPGYVKWYARKRVGGKVLKDEAIKLIKCTAS